MTMQDDGRWGCPRMPGGLIGTPRCRSVEQGVDGWMDGMVSPRRQWKLPGHVREAAEQMGEATGG